MGGGREYTGTQYLCFELCIGGALARMVRAGQLFGLFPIPTPMGEAANSDFVPLSKVGTGGSKVEV